ncbi:unnamed protein product [Parascedosporium putredinis]|uniref:Zn(2)-C6 fungal-type domain-containing protein n=1 Tax=Parascedosporium putredinis TaxID=1442378 RepID=A0A9P1H143_9PEZI|nr:unnamed protein product [Parascedosporium putredinis]CAI7993405.1 unnamed protein product [Parascedosporium putredinis]
MARPPLRKRAKQACVPCNARRVKCDAGDKTPCTNCSSAGTVCEIRESRRGKHPRHSRGLAATRSSRRAETSEAGVATPAPTTPSVANEDTLTPGSSRVSEDIAASHVLATLRRDPGSDVEANPERRRIRNPPVTGPTQSLEGPGLTFQPDEEGSVFLGEQDLRFYHSIPNAIKAASVLPPWAVERRETKVELLRAQGVFSYPDNLVVKEILKAYFQWFHPCFAVVDEPDIWRQYGDGTISHFLLQAMLFIGCLHCDEDYLRDAGLGGRRRAKYLFYNRAKDIYDVGFEQKKLVVIQALFHLSFWRDGALFEKDVRHWLGVTLSLAQSKGFHRCAGMGQTKVDRLKRRLWWSLYTRERQCAAALGLPNRVRDEDCDVDMLTEADFTSAFQPSTPPEVAAEWVAYVISMTQLARTLGRLCHCGYLPGKVLSTGDRNAMRDDLIRWKDELPRAMRLDQGDFDAPPSFYANMLHLSYNNLLILLYRAGFIGGPESRGVDGGVALQAASRNARIVEDMLPGGQLRHAHVHVITNLFNTLTAPRCNWVLRLFFQYLDRSTAARLQMEDDSASTCEGPRVEPRVRLGEVVDAEVRMAAAPMGFVPSGNEEAGAVLDGATPWSWSLEEANQFLFSQIENDFVFGDGALHTMSTEEDFA